MAPEYMLHSYNSNVYHNKVIIFPHIIQSRYRYGWL